MNKNNVNQCKWCSNPAIESHLTPGSILRTAEKKLGSFKLRRSPNLNKVVQDIGKVPLLCHDHDNLFSRVESNFRELIYIKLLEGQTKFNYDEWLSKFAISIAWKRLATGLPKMANLDLHQVMEANKALKHWEGYLLGNHQETEPYQHHLLLTWFYANRLEISRVVRGILLETFDTTIIPYPEGLLVWTTFPGCILISSTSPWTYTGWETIRILAPGHFNENQILPWSHLSPYIQEAIAYGLERTKLISPRQREKLRSNGGSSTNNEAFSVNCFANLFSHGIPQA